VALFHYFKLFVNMFFLLTCVSQFIPSFSVGLLMSFLPTLVIVVTFYLCKEAYDDIKRHRLDAQINNEKFERLVKITNQGGPGVKLEQVAFKDIKVGDIVLLN